MNDELEVHFAQYLYSTRQSYYEEKWEKQYTDIDRYIAIKETERYVDSKGNLKNGIDEYSLELHLLNEVGAALKQFGYKEPNYRYEDNKYGMDNFKDLEILAKNC